MTVYSRGGGSDDHMAQAYGKLAAVLPRLFLNFIFNFVGKCCSLGLFEAFRCLKIDAILTNLETTSVLVFWSYEAGARVCCARWMCAWMMWCVRPSATIGMHLLWDQGICCLTTMTQLTDLKTTVIEQGHRIDMDSHGGGSDKHMVQAYGMRW